MLQAILVVSCLGTSAWAATPCGAEMPCTFGISDTGIQMSKGVLKFQARISQAKMPIPQGELLAVEVNLVDPTQKKRCGQKFNNVKVLNSILNLDFEPTDCALDQVVAAIPDLQLQLVIGGYPVKTIPLGTVPYALKANHAVKAQEAHHADVAAQAHYAHRITADRQTLQANAIGTGYFDFYTPQNGGNLYDALTYAQHAKDGFVQWTPVKAPPVLHFAAKGVGDDKLTMLDAVHLESKRTITHGSLVIDPRYDAGVEGIGLEVKAGGAQISGSIGYNWIENQDQFANASLTMSEGKSGIKDIRVFSCVGDLFDCNSVTPDYMTAAVVAIDRSSEEPWSNEGRYGLFAFSQTGTAVSGLASSKPGVEGQSYSGSGTSGTSYTGSGASGVSNTGHGISGSSTFGHGVHGFAHSYGVFGETQNGSGIGVGGEAQSGTGVAGSATSGNGVSGNATSGTGVRGTSTNGTGVLGTGQLYGVTGTGVIGVYGDGTTYGVFGSSATGDGVIGQSNTNIGVRGYSGSGVGVSGSSTQGNGLSGGSQEGYGAVLQSSGPRAQLRLVPRTLPTAADTGDIAFLLDGTLHIYTGPSAGWRVVQLGTTP